MNQSRWYRGLLLAAVVAVAVYLRADRLGDPQFWYDEAICSLRSTGHTEHELVAWASERGAVPIGDWVRFMRPDPSRSVGDAVHSLAAEDPQHTPAYYVLSYYWARWFGGEPEIVRIPAVIFSVLMVPAMFWLCFELFVASGMVASTAVCWIGMAVVAVSPYHVAFGREHREYSMWALALMLASAALLRALRLNRFADWAVFALALTFAAQSHMLTWLVWVGLGVFVLIRYGIRASGRFRNFLFATVIAGATFLPWAVVVLRGRQTIQNDLRWVETITQEKYLFRHAFYPHFRAADSAFLGIIAQPFGPEGPRHLIWIVPSVLILGALVVYASRRRAKPMGFIAILFSTTTVPFIIADYFEGTVMGWVTRYEAPAIIAWNLAVTLALACLILEPGRWRRLRRVAAAAMLAASAWSGYLIHDDIYPFHKMPNDRGYAAQFLNNTITQVTVVSDEYVGSLLSLAHHVRPEVPILARPRCLNCPRPGTKVVDIPDVGDAKNPVFYRSWFNEESFRVAMQDALSNDTLGDPRYHTRSVPAVGSGLFLYEVTPR